MLRGKKVLVGVTGSIAAYKAAILVSRLKGEGAEVFVVMTPNATHFIAPLTLRTLSGRNVYVEMFPPSSEEVAEHVWLGETADVVVVAPATANIIGKVAAGIADDMLSTVIMAAQGPVLFAPAMHASMYQNPVVQENVDRLKKMGYHFVGPVEGKLARGEVGVGRMVEIEDIMEKLVQVLDARG